MRSSQLRALPIEIEVLGAYPETYVSLDYAAVPPFLAAFIAFAFTKPCPPYTTGSPRALKEALWPYTGEGTSPRCRLILESK